MVKGLPDATRVVFDDQRVVANAGVLLPAVLAGRLGIEALVDATVSLGDRDGAANAGRKVMTLVSAMVLGADCIDDCGVLRSGQTRAVLGHRVAAPSTLGTFLRAFTLACRHVRQLDKVLADCLSRAWAAGAGPGEGRLVVDVDSFVGEVLWLVTSRAPAMGTPTRAGYHPIVATRAATGWSVLHICREEGVGQQPRAVRLRFVEELIPRVAVPAQQPEVVAGRLPGSGTTRSSARLERRGSGLFDQVRQTRRHIKATIAQIPEQDWSDPRGLLADGCKAQIAQAMLGRQRVDHRRPPGSLRTRPSCGPNLRASRVLDQSAADPLRTRRS